MRTLERLPIETADFATRYGPWAVIAGASEGTGACFAEQLAAMGISVVLVSRRPDALRELGRRLKQGHGVDFRVLALDLSEAGAGSCMVSETADLDVGLYISNAGADGAGNAFLEAPIERARRLTRMNVLTLVEAAHGFGNRMRARGGGGMIVMSSGAGLGGQPRLAMYSATKAFELCFAESLWAEWAADGIDVATIAAPMMNTPTLRRETEHLGIDLSAMTYNPEDVVHNALATLAERQPVLIVPDGPGEEKLAQAQADRRSRVSALAEWAKAYNQQR